eukprot:916308-Amphidinium_carterae.1
MELCARFYVTHVRLEKSECLLFHFPSLSKFGDQISLGNATRGRTPHGRNRATSRAPHECACRAVICPLVQPKEGRSADAEYLVIISACQHGQFQKRSQPA